MLDKYADVEDSPEADPDYEPDESGNLDTTIDSVNSENAEEIEKAYEELQGKMLF